MAARKDYKAIAGIIKYEYTKYDNTGEDDSEAKIAILRIVSDLVRYFETNNPRFNAQKFINACGIED